MSPRRYVGVDIGNSGLRVVELRPDSSSLGATTRIYWSFEGHEVKPQVGLKTRVEASEARFSPGSKHWIRVLQPWFDQPGEVQWLISSVRGDAQRVLADAIQKQQNHRARNITYRDLPLCVKTEEPGRVGIDRLLAAVAAAEAVQSGGDRRLLPREPVIVIQAGSAVTVDLLTWKVRWPAFRAVRLCQVFP